MKGHGSRGSAGAGREAVPLRERGRAAGERGHRPVALEVRGHTSRQPPGQRQPRPHGKTEPQVYPHCYMQSKMQNPRYLDWSWWSEGQQKPGLEAHRGGGLRDSGNLVWRLTVVGAEGQRRPGVEAHRGGLSDSRNLVLRLTVVGG